MTKIRETLPRNIAHNGAPLEPLPGICVDNRGTAKPETPSQTLEVALRGLPGGRPRVRPGFAAQNVLKALRALTERHSLAAWVARYLAEEVYVLQSHNTLMAKTRDLTGFVTWFVEVNGHGHIEDWASRDTQLYLNALEGLGRAPTTINRVFASLRHFARWAHEQPGEPFARGGLPSRGIRALTVDEPECKKLDRRDMHGLFKAADTLVQIDTRKNARPRRNRAILALLYFTGLRVGELVMLRRDQYRDGYLVNVARKGKARSKGLYVVAECRRYLADYLDCERHLDDSRGDAVPLFLPTHGTGGLTRQLVTHVLKRIALEASKYRQDKIELHPHRLRHTFGAEFRAKSGSDTETAAALGHTGLQYVGRYVRKSKQERENELEEVFSPK